MRRMLLLTVISSGLTLLGGACGPKQAKHAPPAPGDTPRDDPAQRGAAAPRQPVPEATAPGAERAPAAGPEAAPSGSSETRSASATTRAGTRSVMSARPICYRKCQEEFERCVARAAARGGKGRLGCNGAQRECIASCDRLLK